MAGGGRRPEPEEFELVYDQASHTHYVTLLIVIIDDDKLVTFELCGSPSTYGLQIAARGKPGDDGFYVVDVALLADNPREQAEADNGKPEAAESVPEPPSLALNATRCSGVRGLRAQLLDKPDHTLASAQAPSSENLLLDGIDVQASGAQRVRLSNKTPAVSHQTPEAVEPWVRCVAIVGP